MRCNTLLALAGYTSLAYASTHSTPVSFKNCPANAVATLGDLASDALKITGVVKSMLKVIENDATPPAAVVPGSLAANVRELVVRWFGEAALPEHDVGENDLRGFSYFQGMYTRMYISL
ncbi:hypothetical protein CLAFUW4_06464 [Fulvia fulva]|uniref:Uncharacterized protein n=1 Tax=Passalora fulva TaxID=5499 RepID=A0A9Q8LH35_PASFU|nr:uncharacterized protein CLAFUR5_06608 [Fulvia fulva]KAK4624627.1 hypothetical protein CLAFUR4_06468 [Fulvia fulva]KAK4625977.1 hypothetical protein CLAFUR0_06469 [Fulvia fulva]UJO17511.1 hypothetical protein CLAFUR5_06608 [Fulvia fulva]WPV14829.1 hypothetical protein CLAFUW4_06464 [Fulvia fulva]WPV29684.1 hypothetical protein CLAFUW7_06464 [Fulvia fulva]